MIIIVVKWLLLCLWILLKYRPYTISTLSLIEASDKGIGHRREVTIIYFRSNNQIIHKRFHILTVCEVLHIPSVEFILWLYLLLKYNGLVYKLSWLPFFFILTCLILRRDSGETSWDLSISPRCILFVISVVNTMDPRSRKRWRLIFTHCD